MDIYKPNKFAALVGGSVKTLLRWDNDGKLKAHRSPLLGDITHRNNTGITWVMDIQSMAKRLFIREFQRQIKKMIC